MPIHIYGSGASSDEAILHEHFLESAVSYARDYDTVTLTFPLSTDSACSVEVLAIKKMRIGESESGAANRYRWCFSGVFRGATGTMSLVNDSDATGWYDNSVSFSYKQEGKNLILTFQSEDTVGNMDEDATYFNDFDADLFYTVN